MNRVFLPLLPERLFYFFIHVANVSPVLLFSLLFYLFIFFLTCELSLTHAVNFRRLVNTILELMLSIVMLANSAGRSGALCLSPPARTHLLRGVIL